MNQLFEFISNHYLLVIGFLVVTYFLVQELIDTATRKHKVTSPMLAVNLMNQENSLVLDVRDPNEFANGHVSGSKNIPLAKLDERADELSAYKNSPILLICQAGTRSSSACKKLVKQGFTEIHDIRGGIQAWQEANLPITKGKK